jgi:methyltransferase family protein
MDHGITYAAPREIVELADCSFYHCMDLPGVGTVGDHWDLRSTIDAYLGGFDFAGKTALDVGAASGFLTFEMEKRGAEVISFDIPDGGDWDYVPFAKPEFDAGKLVKELRWHVDRIKNAYWYAHRALGSRARAYYGDIYDIPAALGPVDVAVFGMVLPHLRDPFRALASAARLARGSVIVVQQGIPARDPHMHFMPDPKTLADPITWWFMSEGCVERMLQVLGFELKSKRRADHHCVIRKRWESCTTFIARRVHEPPAPLPR